MSLSKEIEMKSISEALTIIETISDLSVTLYVNGTKAAPVDRLFLINRLIENGLCVEKACSVVKDGSLVGLYLETLD